MYLRSSKANWEGHYQSACFGCSFIWVRLFWNQNLTWRGSSPSSRLNSFLCLSSGCGYSLKNLHIIHSFATTMSNNILKRKPHRSLDTGLDLRFELLDLVLGVAVVALLAGWLQAEILLQLLTTGAWPGTSLHVVAGRLALHQQLVVAWAACIAHSWLLAAGAAAGRGSDAAAAAS